MKFQDATPELLNKILSDKIFTVFNYSQLLANIVNVESSEIFQRNINLNSDSIDEVITRLNIYPSEENYFTIFELNVNNAGGKLYFKKNKNRIDCEVFVIFNDEELEFITSKDLGDKIYQNFKQQVLMFKGNEANLDEITLEQANRLKNTLMNSFLEHISKNRDVISIDIGINSLQAPINKFIYHNQIVLYNRLKRSMSEYIDTQIEF